MLEMTGWRALLLMAVMGSVMSLPSSPKDAQPKPHIILIVADDLGWNDVSWHNPQALTPNLEELARTGVLLNQSYVQPICTPTRSALLTGRYPYTLGRQHGVLWPKEPTGLTIKRQLLPQALKAAGYSTHIVGKWHLGFCSWDYTPTSRGFDTFWGYYTGAEDYYHHTRPSFFSEDQSPYDFAYSNEYQYNDSSVKFGYDFRNNTLPEYSVDGEYSTYLFSSYIENMLETRSPSDPMFLYLPFQSVHAPLQVPHNYTEPFAHIKHHDRRVKFGMVLAMDEAVGGIVRALKDSGHYNNSVIVFTTDNGGPTVSAGNNWPLRGNKSTLWEGGTRGAAFVHSPLLPQKGIVSNKLIHVTDWFSTLVGLGGGEVPGDTNGYDQWEAITTDAPSPRREMVYNIDVTTKLSAGIRMGDYKLLVGDPGPGEWTPPPEGIKNNFINETIDDLKEMDKDKNVTSRSELSELLQKILLEKGKFYSSNRNFLQSKNLNGEPFYIEASEDYSNSVEGNVDREFHGDITDFQSTENPNKMVINSTTSQEDNWMNIEAENDLVTLGDLNLDLDMDAVFGSLVSNHTMIRLYNVIRDPEERKNLAAEKQDVVQVLLALIANCKKDYVAADILPNDPAANPVHWNNTWTPGWCRAK